MEEPQSKKYAADNDHTSPHSPDGAWENATQNQSDTGDHPTPDHRKETAQTISTLAVRTSRTN